MWLWSLVSRWRALHESDAGRESFCAECLLRAERQVWEAGGVFNDDYQCGRRRWWLAVRVILGVARRVVQLHELVCDTLDFNVKYDTNPCRAELSLTSWFRRSRPSSSR